MYVCVYVCVKTHEGLKFFSLFIEFNTIPIQNWKVDTNINCRVTVFRNPLDRGTRNINGKQKGRIDYVGRSKFKECIEEEEKKKV